MHRNVERVDEGDFVDIPEKFDQEIEKTSSSRCSGWLDFIFIVLCQGIVSKSFKLVLKQHQ